MVDAVFDSVIRYVCALITGTVYWVTPPGKRVPHLWVRRFVALTFPVSWPSLVLLAIGLALLHMAVWTIRLPIRAAFRLWSVNPDHHRDPI